MDLSKISDADLMALHSGDLSKVSDEGLQYLHTQGKPAAASSDPSLKDPGMQGSVSRIQAGVDPILKKYGLPDSKQLPDQLAEAAFASGPGPHVPGAGEKALFGNAAKRLAIGTATGAAGGAINDPQDRIRGAGNGALKGLGIGLLSEGGNALIGGLGAAKRAMFPGSPQENSDNIRQVLQGHDVEINPSDYTGVDPKVDDIIQNRVSEQAQDPAERFKQVTSGQTPDKISVPAQDLEDIRSTLDSQVDWRTPQSQDKSKILKSRADMARGELHDINPQVDREYRDWASANSAQNSVKQAKKDIAQGDILKGGTKLIGIPGVEAAKGAGRSLMSQSGGEATLRDYLLRLLGRNDQDDKK